MWGKRGGIIAALSLLAGCAHAPVPPPQVAACPAGQSRSTEVELLFGRNVGDKVGVSDDDWKRFVDEVITPRFPDGLSVLDMQGQWRASTGAIVREPSKALMLVLDGGPDDQAKIANIRKAYKDRFHQESVLLVTRQVCASF